MRRIVLNPLIIINLKIKPIIFKYDSRGKSLNRYRFI
jgi:hypothetical protein